MQRAFWDPTGQQLCSLESQGWRFLALWAQQSPLATGALLTSTCVLGPCQCQELLGRALTVPHTSLCIPLLPCLGWLPSGTACCQVSVPGGLS